MGKRVTISEINIDLSQLEFPFNFELNPIIGKRIFYHYSIMEEYGGGLWRKVTAKERQLFVNKASLLMKNAGKFKAAMTKATEKWLLSCEVNLTDLSQNRIAWIGHAGCCVGCGSPEDVTREAWWTLNGNEQDRANKAAEEVIKEWEMTRYAKKVSRN